MDPRIKTLCDGLYSVCGKIICFKDPDMLDMSDPGVQSDLIAFAGGLGDMSRKFGWQTVCMSCMVEGKGYECFPVQADSLGEPRRSLVKKELYGMAAAACTFMPSADIESVDVMRAFARAHGIEFEDEGAVLWNGGMGGFGFPSPGGYGLCLPDGAPGSLWDEIRDKIREGTDAYARGGHDGTADPEIHCGSLPDDSVHLFRTPGGTVFVDMIGYREDGLHRLAWGTGYADTPVPEGFVYFAPAGTLYELHVREMFYEFAARTLSRDICDARWIPGLDIREAIGRRNEYGPAEKHVRQERIRKFNQMLAEYKLTRGGMKFLPDGRPDRDTMLKATAIAVRYRDRMFAARPVRPGAPAEPAAGNGAGDVRRSDKTA